MEVKKILRHKSDVEKGFNPTHSSNYVVSR